MTTHTHEWPGEYRYCPHCATELEAVVRGGRPRMRCPACGFVHWRNPGVGVAVVLRDEQGRVLLVKRGPHSTQPGKWCVPAGFVDYGEDVIAAAARELGEETGLDVSVGKPIMVASNYHDPDKLSIGIWFDGDITGGTLAAGDDAVDVGWFDLDDLPPIAFDTDLALFQILRTRAD